MIGTIPSRDAQGNLVNQNTAFASKDTFHFRAHGIKQTVQASATTDIEFVIPYAHVRFNGINILWGDNGDTANLKVKDTAQGSYSTIPNMVLDQFGFNWNIETAGTKEVMPYYADLYQGMRIIVEYTNSTNTEKEIAINFYLHEEE